MDTSREVMRQKKAKPDLAEMDCASTQLVSPEGVPVPKDPSTLMSTLINEADSALRNARPPARAVNTLRDARYGLRGVRVGEASHPTEAVNQVGRGVQLERSAIDSARDVGCRHNVGQRCGRKSPFTTQTFTGCWKWDHTNGGGYASGRSPREPFLATHGGNR